MPSWAEAWMRLRVDDTQVKKDTERGLSKADGTAAGRHVGKGFTTGFSGVTKSIAKIVAAGFAIKVGVDMFSGMIDSAREAARVDRITAAVIKSTGGAAHVTAKQIQDMGVRIMKLTGADDETIKSGANMLLTFRNIRNEAGKGNDIFNRATMTLADMSSAMHGGDLSAESMRKSAIQLGKALNDPIKGITALSRVGVAFTDKQKKQITALTESGHALKAQKIILRELGKEFGGTAAAAADPLQKLKTMFGEVGESIGTKMLGPLTSLTNFIINKAMPAASDLWSSLKPLLAKGLHALATGVPTTPAAPAGHAPVVAPPPVTGWEKFLTILHNIGVEVGRAVGPALVSIGRTLAGLWPQLLPAFRDLGKFIADMVPVVRNLWKAWAPILGPVLKAAIVVIVVAFKVLAWTLAHIVGPALIAMSVVTKNVLGWIVSGVRGAGKVWTTVWGALKSLVAGIVKSVEIKFLTMIDKLLGGLRVLTGALGHLPGAFGAPFRAASKAIDGTRDHVQNLIDKLKGVHSKSITVVVSGHGHWGIDELSPGGPGGVPRPLSALKQASGGPIRGPGGPTDDRVLMWGSNDEYMIKAAAHRKYGTHMLDMINAGKYAGGGVVGNYANGATGLGTFVAREERLTERAIERAVAAAITAALRGPAGMVRYAESYVGKVPYVWGGTTPAGWDCSGFTSWVYNHFGYGAPRTSEQQGAWVQRTGPVPGALAFFTGAGGPSPGHVGLIVGRNLMVNAAGTRTGTTYGDLSGMLWSGVPPQGFDSGGLLMPGRTLAVNNTGRPEMILPMDAFMPMRQLVKALVDPGGPMRKLVRAFDPGGPMKRLTVALDPGGPMKRLTVALDPGGPMKQLTKALVNPGGPIHRAHTGGWGGWGNLTWPADHPWGGSHPRPDKKTGKRHTGGWGGWGNLTWPKDHAWAEPVWGIGRSGQRYTFGEGWTGQATPGSGLADRQLMERLVEATEAAPARTAALLSDAFTMVGRRSVHLAQHAGGSW